MRKSQTRILYGGDLAKGTKEYVKKCIIRENLHPVLGIITVNGGNDASQVYLKNKVAAAKDCGIEVKYYSTAIGDLEATIAQADKECTGIMIQRPIVNFVHSLERYYCDLIPEYKDVDVMGYRARGGFYADQRLAPCTPMAVMRLLDYYKISLKGQNVVIISRSDVVGKPLAELCLNEDATVTVCHSKTPVKMLKKFCKKADIIITAAGVPKLLTRDMVKKGSVVIDVSINRDKNGALCGDADFWNLLGKVAAITPVPKGVGAVTTAELMFNTYVCCLFQVGERVINERLCD